MKTRCTLFLLAVCLLVPVLSHAQWTNEPVGSQLLVDCNFVSTPGSCGIQDIYNSSILSSDASAPVSPPWSSKALLQAYAPTGGMQLVYSTPQPIREMYMGLMWRTNAAFQGRIVTNKLFFIRGLPQIQGNGYFGMWNPPGSSTMKLTWGHNSSGLDNSHTCTLDLGLVCEPNTGSGLITIGAWTKIEVYQKSSTTATSRDGVLRVWINGTKHFEYTNLNYAPGGLFEWQWNNTWDGAQDMGVSNTVNWEHWLDHLRVSVPNCVTGCTGDPGDVTPPSQVTGVATSSVGSTSASLAWTAATDNVGVVGYQVEYCPGSGCTTFENQVSTSTNAITLSGLLLGSPYSARVKAYDAAGNVSASYSSTVSFTTSGTALPSITTVDADATGANVAWTGSPSSIRVLTDTLNIVEPMTAFPVASETIAYVQSSSTTGSGSSIGRAYTSSNTAGNFLALRYTGAPSSVTISTCSDTRGNTWTPIPNATGGTGGHQAMRYAKNVSAGANTVTCTLTGAATASSLDIFEYSGVDRTAPLDQSKLTQQVDPGTGANAVSSGSVTTTADGELILGGTLQVGSTTYSASTDFSSTQGPIWYYKDSSGTNLTWSGSYWYGSGYLGLWDTGGHPGNPLDAMRRWVAPADGSVRITGTALNYSGCATNGTNLTIQKNGATLWTQFVPGTGTYPYDISTTVVATDTIDFLIDNNGADTCDSTQFDPTITLGTSSGSGGTTTNAGTGFTLRHASFSDSPVEDQIQTSAGSIAATFTGADALNDYITSIATFRPASTSIRYSRSWAIGTTFVCMYARDALGNENTNTSGYRCDPVIAAADTTAPVRSGFQPSGTLASGTTTATLIVMTDEFSTCKYGTTPGVAYGSISLSLTASSNGLFHSKGLTGLTDGSSYTYYVRCQDVFGNANGADSTISFTVNNVSGDVTAPSTVVGLEGTALNANQVALTWTPSTDDTAVTGYDVYVAEAGSDYFLAASFTTASGTVLGLSPDTLLFFKVRARDAVGNVGDFSDPIVVRTLMGDVTSPSDLAGMTVTAVDFQSLDVAWTAGTDDVGILSSNLEQCTGVTCTDFRLVAAVHGGTSVRLSGLSPQTTYRFRGKHADAAGNVSLNYSTIVTGTTLAVPVGTVTAICPCKHHR